MGLVYLPIFSWFFMVNVGTYTHTWSIWEKKLTSSTCTSKISVQHLFFLPRRTAEGWTKPIPFLGGVQPIGFLKLWNEANTSSFEKPAWADLAPNKLGRRRVRKKTHRFNHVKIVWNYHLCQHSIIIRHWKYGWKVVKYHATAKREASFHMQFKT